MAYFSFTKKLINKEKIPVFNYGDCKRDFTYIDDIVEGIRRVILPPPKRKKGEDGLPIPPYKIYNIGKGTPENLMDFITLLAEALIKEGLLSKNFNVKDYIDLLPMQPGDVPVTFADTAALEKDIGYKPGTDFKTAIRQFAKWYKDYYS